jgi:antitoxin component YwqK of YwqJK toxin-antitoxin module
MGNIMKHHTIEFGGNIYIGRIKNDMYHGTGTLYDKDHNIIYEGNWKHGKYHGTGKLYDKNGNIIYEGNWKHGKYHGQGILFYPNGRIKYYGNFKNGYKHGQGAHIEYEGNQEIIIEGKFIDDRYQTPNERKDILMETLNKIEII